MLSCVYAFSAVIQSSDNTEDNKRREENGEHLVEKDSKEQFRHRQPHTKPANP